MLVKFHHHRKEGETIYEADTSSKIMKLSRQFQLEKEADVPVFRRSLINTLHLSNFYWLQDEKVA